MAMKLTLNSSSCFSFSNYADVSCSTLATKLLLNHSEDIIALKAPQFFGECYFILFNASFIIKKILA